MVRLKSGPLAAIGAGPVPPPQELNPFDGRIRVRDAELAGSPSSVDALPDVAVVAAILSEIQREPFFVPFVVRAIRGGVLGRMAFAPATHGFTGLRRIGPYPRAGILTTAVNVLVRHLRSLAGPLHRGKVFHKKDAAFWPRLCCGGTIRTSDLRVMSPTSYRCSTPRTNSTSNETQRRTRTIARSVTDLRSPCEPTRRSTARRAARR